MQSELAAMKQESAPVTQMMNVGRLPSNGEGQDAVDGKVEEEDATGKKSAKVVATSSSQSEDGGDDGKPPSNMQLVIYEMLLWAFGSPDNNHDIRVFTSQHSLYCFIRNPYGWSW